MNTKPYCILLLLLFVFQTALNSQKLDWIYNYKTVSRAHKINKVSDQVYIVSGYMEHANLIFCGLFDSNGQHLKTYTFENRNYSSSVAFQGVLPNGEIALLLYDGRLMRINPLDYSIDSSLADIQTFFWEPVTIYQAYLKHDTLCVVGYNTDANTLYFEYSFYNNSYSNIKGNLKYPYTTIGGFFNDRSMYSLRKNDSMFFEHFTAPYDKAAVSIRIDTFFTRFQKAILSHTKDYYLIGMKSDSSINAVICAFDATGQFKWSRIFRPEIISKDQRHFKWFYDLKETSTGDLFLVGTEGYYIIGPISNSIIIKLDAGGQLIWEQSANFSIQGEASNEIELDSSDNCYVVGTMGLSDYPIPNRAYILKYSNSSVATNHVNPQEHFKIFPIPASDYFIIQPSGLDDCKELQIELYNILGKLIFKSNGYTCNEAIPLKGIANQFCMIRIVSKGRTLYFDKLFLK